MRLREDFWSSRVEGNVHMWQNIRSAAEALASDDVMLANAILEVRFIYFCMDKSQCDQFSCAYSLHAWILLCLFTLAFGVGY